jgi:hypothetical protein
MVETAFCFLLSGASSYEFVSITYCNNRFICARSASFMVRHNIISEEADLLQGRVPKSVFVRHYLKENPRELRDRTLKAITELEQTLN